ncbi:MAG TPA: response regulator transcription factor [Actinomycetota bacterium]|nr:response regulator transcription factor [Actinomycetota bacterium]
MEDHRLFAEAIRPTLERLGMDVAIATSGREAIEQAMRRSIDVALVDLGLPDMGGEEVGSRLLEIRRTTVVVALTATDDDVTVRRTISSGFRAYLTKDLRLSALSRALRSALAGETVTLPRAPRPRVRSGGPSDGFVELLSSSLTPREREVLQMLARGNRGKDIARELAISVNTVRTHVQSILTKLQVHSRLEAAAFAVRHGLVDRAPAIGPDQEGR